MMEPNPTLLSHLDADARPRMVDVGGKTATDRVAHAQARVRFPPEVATQLREAGFVLPKGSVLTVAHIAGVMGAKVTSQLIPLCHPLALQRCDITIDMEGDSAVIDCTVACHGTTGVEMEALTGASIAALTLYDMCKALSHAIVIEQVRLVAKRGGKSDLAYPS